MNKKKIVKDWIIDKVEFINYKYTEMGHDGFKFELNDRLAYLFYDKGVPKRISKWLKKKYNIDSESSIGYDHPYSYSIHVRIRKDI
ncbi:hypothetical protein H7E67_01290 [Clostridium gasigenes]|uniref:hypothetical protein n=1 Tax=Clostridium gasigenes TaxID=94869 RepID=UPI001624C1CA|nr:hypothetical protein [Clostridium gasigenes]MBB6622053.1 hypothetical protein [Clostridium gasigenes]